MLSSVLRSPQAIKVNIAVMRAFVKLREILASHADLARKLESMEQKYDTQFKVVFDGKALLYVFGAIHLRAPQKWIVSF